MIFRAISLTLLALGPIAGCHVLPIAGAIRTDANVNASGQFAAKLDVHLPTTGDPGPMVAKVIRPGGAGPGSPRVALIDVDGLLLNQNLTGLYSAGENPVAALREKLAAAAADPGVRAVVLRINSPGGGVTACDIMAEELRRFRGATGRPAVACLMDTATAGAYYLALGCDRVIAHPTTITGGIGALFNYYNLQDAMAQLNARAEPIKAGELIDMGSVLGPLPDEARALLQEMTDGFRDRFWRRVVQARPALTAADRATLADGRVISASTALRLHLVDGLGYVDDAIAEAERAAGLPPGAEVVLYGRAGQASRSIYAITPNVPVQGDLVPFSYPALERSKMPTFLYLWQPDPTVTRVGGR